MISIIPKQAAQQAGNNKGSNHSQLYERVKGPIRSNIHNAESPMNSFQTYYRSHDSFRTDRLGCPTSTNLVQVRRHVDGGAEWHGKDGLLPSSPTMKDMNLSRLRAMDMRCAIA